MRLFKQISYNPEPSVIGVNNGIYQLEFKERDLKKNFNYEEIEQILMTFDIAGLNKIKELPIEHLKGTLLKKAKVTDLMVFSPHLLGHKYLISQKVVDCLKEMVATREYHLRKVEIEAVKENYYLLFVPMILTNEIDFTQARIFPEREYLSESRTYFEIDSYAEYQNLLDENPLVSFEKICLPKKYQNQDIISVQGAVDLFFSEQLIECLQEAEVTNFRIPKRQIELVFSESVESLRDVRNK